MSEHGLHLDDPTTPEGRGEADCLFCQTRVLRNRHRLARLAKPEGLYMDGVNITVCDKPACNKQADHLDGLYGRPDQPAEYSARTIEAVRDFGRS